MTHIDVSQRGSFDYLVTTGTRRVAALVHAASALPHPARCRLVMFDGVKHAVRKTFTYFKDMAYSGARWSRAGLPRAA